MRQFKPKLKVAKISFLSPLHIRSRVQKDTGLLCSPCSALNLRDAIGPLPRPAIAIPSPAGCRLLTSLAGVASPQGSGRRAGKRFPAQAFPPAAPFRRKAPTIFPAGCGRGRRMGPVSIQTRDFSISPARRWRDRERRNG